jgi:hypothetical protein
LTTKKRVDPLPQNNSAWVMYGKDFMLCITYPGCQTNMRLKDLDSPDGPKSSTCAILMQSKFLKIPFNPFPFELLWFLPIEHTSLRLLYRINIF